MKARIVQIESESNIRARHIMETTTRRKGNRYDTGLLWCRDDIYLPDSYGMAFKRLEGIERKMKSDPMYATEYRKNINYCQVGMPENWMNMK